MAKRLWDKGEEIDTLMAQLTVGSDPEVDRAFVCADCVGSAAHARMLEGRGILSKADCLALLKELKEIFALGKERNFFIPPELEDVHTAIEATLSEKLGESGKRIHAGRSRNDQVILALRLYLREQTVAVLANLITLSKLCLKRFSELAEQPLPGYTHLQPAMPSSVGMWLHAFLEAFLESLRGGLQLLELNNLNPLGSAAGFGSSIPLDRAAVASLLGFSGVQRSFIDVQNSRGRYELRFLRWLEEIACTLEKFAWDISLFTTREFGIISLPNKLTTGSSIMPQKRNPDLAELLRAKASRVRACAYELAAVTAKLPSSYHRDLQYTKEPLVRGSKELGEACQMAQLLLEHFSINEVRARELMSSDLYATYDAYRQVLKGRAFRDAYIKTAKRVQDGTLQKEELAQDFQTIQQEVRDGVKEAREELSALSALLGSWQQRLQNLEERIFNAD